MKKHVLILLGLLVIFSSLFTSCNEEELDPNICKITVKSEGNGKVAITDYIGTSVNVLIGNRVEVVATPDDGWAFIGWYIGGTESPVSTDAAFTFTTSESVTLTARFAQSTVTHKVTIRSNGYGNVSFKDYPGNSIAVMQGTEVTVLASPDEYCNFVGWFIEDEESLVSTDAEYKFDVTDDVTLTAKFNNPLPSIAAIPAGFYDFGKLTGEGNHNDFFYPATMMFTDSRGMDMVSDDIGYNWFASSLVYSDLSWTNFTPYSIWTTAYKQISVANSVVQTIGTYEPADDDLKFYLAQALAIRAFDYYTLAQYFQHTYVGNENKPCAPLINEKNMVSAANEGCSRSTVAEVYKQIMGDLDCAIDLLSTSSTARVDKRYVDLAVAYGMRARVNLVMNNWPGAASDAQNAIANTTAVPYSISDVNHPGFSDIEDAAWMWGILVAETDRPVTSGICNFPSHMGSLNYGYASAGAWRRINKSLYAQIPATDVRKGWWLDENAQSPNLNAEQAAYAAQYAIPAYTHMKFGCYNNVTGTSTNANDIPLMRVEEMYLTLAEAQAMAGDPATGAATLEAFVKTYRDPEYTCAATSSADVQDAVWFQRRIELWGEGFSYADMMRLKKNMDRRGAGFEAHTTFFTSATEGGKNYDARILPIPQNEIEANAMLTVADNNPTASIPEPVAE